MSHAIASPTVDDLHDTDLFLWSREQARLLEERRFDELDLENLIDELKSVGNSEKREIRSRLAVLVMHLLEWRYQPGRRTPSWETTIRDQRTELRSVLDDNPSLRGYPVEHLRGAFDRARLDAARETGIDFTLFPRASPFTIDQVLDPDFLPSHPDLDPTP